LNQAQQLLSLCNQFGATFIVNDDVDLAAAVHAHGVHLGGEDVPLPQARQRLGAEAVIGASCYNRLELAVRAQQQGADYVAFGRFFPSRTKPQAVPADIALLRQAKAQLHLPIVAIGGITAQNGAQLIAAGADMLAVVEAVFAQEDIAAAARQLAECFL
jgi:thiamine-phosphate pyrophosphorylase